ncbi:MAG: hypothetical protein AAGN46_09635 [Acidobacteriota bacterium]
MTAGPVAASSRGARQRQRPQHDPWRVLDRTIEREPRQLRSPTGDRPTVVRALTLFLVGAECPFSCVFCDLWRFTLEGPTPPGAIPRQIAGALEEVDVEERHHALAGSSLEPLKILKLYNASNFFDHRAVPVEDDAAIADLARGRGTLSFDEVVVECHPRLVGERCRRFAERLDGRLQVAIGLETVHPEAFARLGKGATLNDVRGAADRLRAWDIGLRVFLLIAPPFVARDERLSWTRRSVEAALEFGAERVALVPLRGTQPAVRQLAAAGTWQPPTLDEIEATLDVCHPLAPGRIAVDPWDLEAFVTATDRDPARRIERLRDLAEGGAAVEAAS